MGKNNLVLLDKGDLASSSSWSGHRHFMGTEENQWSSGTDVPQRETSPILLTAIIFQTMQLVKRKKSQGKVREVALSFTLITKIQIRISQRRMLDHDRLSSPSEVTKEGEQRPFKSLWKTAW